MSAEGIYHFKIYTQLGNEKYFINDTLREGRHSRVLTLPYVENFNQSNGGWQTGGTGLWEWGTTAKMGGSGTPAWVTRLSGSYNDNENAWLLSPPFDLSGLNADPVVSYNIKYSTEACCDRVYYEYSVDGGTTWSTLRTFAGTSSNSWIHVSDTLKLTGCSNSCVFSDLDLHQMDRWLVTELLSMILL